MITLRIKLYKEKPDGSVNYAEPRFHPRNQLALFEIDEIEYRLNITFAQIQEAIEKWTHNGSGWIVDRVVGMSINISKYQPSRGGSYMYIKLPKYISDKKAWVNVKNKDDNCLRWALCSFVFQVIKNVDRTSSYPSEDSFNFDGINAPTLMNQINKVEKANEMAINVYGYENKAIVVYQVSNQPASMKQINVLLIHKGTKSHYVWIKDLNRLLYDQTLWSNKSPVHYVRRLQLSAWNVGLPGCQCQW